MKTRAPFYSIFLMLFFLFSCASSPDAPPKSGEKKESKEKPPVTSAKKYLSLTFAGDIMSHSVNSRMKNYDIIYDDVRDILRSDDLSFANFETPVDKTKSYETYPNFNVQPPYAQAAFRAGFDVFTLANNHSNDQGVSSIKETIKFFESSVQDEIYFSGLNEKPLSPLSYTIIEKNNFKILFLGVSEFFNGYGESVDYINYVPRRPNARARFKEELKQIRQENKVDFFVLGIHVEEPEYVLDVPDDRKNFFYELLDCGVDIVWASHPHVMQEWELIKSPTKGDKFIMYSMGNFISGQRYTLNSGNPSAMREYTGDAILLQVNAKKEGNKIIFDDLNEILITNYVDSEKNILVKRFTESFVKTLTPALQEYYYQRMELMAKIKGTIKYVD
ncbi:MAG: CapA family protein [Treponemataceae bacterium]